MSIVGIHNAILARINEGILRVDVAEHFERSCEPVWSEKTKSWHCGCAVCTEWPAYKQMDFTFWAPEIAEFDILDSHYDPDNTGRCAVCQADQPWKAMCLRPDEPESDSPIVIEKEQQPCVTKTS